MSEQEAMQEVIGELYEFTQQDDFLLAHGAPMDSEDGFEIIHMDTVRRIVKIAFDAGKKTTAEIKARALSAAVRQEATKLNILGCQLIREIEGDFAWHDYGLTFRRLYDNTRASELALRAALANFEAPL